MIYNILRYVIALLAGVASYMGIDGAMPLLDPYIDAKFLNSSGVTLTAIKIAVRVAGSLVGAAIGYFISVFLFRDVHPDPRLEPEPRTRFRVQQCHLGIGRGSFFCLRILQQLMRG